MIAAASDEGRPTLLRIVFGFAAALTVFEAGHAGQQPRGPYLGQAPPGAEPTVFAPGFVSTADVVELNAVFTPDGREFLFTRRVGEVLKVFSSRQDSEGFWSSPEMVDFSRANSEWDEVDMWFSADGGMLYYISDAPAPGFAEGSVNIWQVARGKHGWGTPEVLPDPVNTDGDEIYPMPVAGGMYFSSTRGGGFGGRDIYRVDAEVGGFANASGLGAAVNTEANEGDIYVAPDESYLIVTSNREHGFGRSDLYISIRKSDGGWSEAKNLGAPINSEGSDYCPAMSPDERYFFFSRDGDVYWMDAVEVSPELPRSGQETPAIP